MKTKDVELEQLIFKAYLRGISTATLSQTYGLSEAEIQEILDGRLADETRIEDVDPRSLVVLHKAQMEALVEDVAIAATKGGPRDRIMAARINSDIRRHVFDVDREIGLLPQNLGRISVEIELEQMADRLLAFLVDRVDKETLLQIPDVLKDTLPSPDGDATGVPARGGEPGDE
jgi:hypothetical protein